MIKNRTAQLMYQTAYCTLGIVGIVASVGFFDMTFRWDFYILFTNLSNYLCVGIMFAELYQTVKKQEDSYVTACPLLKFSGVLGILLTFFVFNLLLANAANRDPADNFKVSSFFLHVVLPLMFTIDWILFYPKGQVKVSYPFWAMLFPFVYLAYVFVHAALHHFDGTIMNCKGTGPLIYPYFFLDPDKSGKLGVLMWCVALTVIFAIGGFILMGIDRLIKHFQCKTSDEGTESVVTAIVSGELTGFAHSPGYSDMNGGYHCESLRRDKSGAWQIEKRDRNSLDEPEIVKTYAVSDSALAAFEQFLNDKKILALENRKESDEFVTDYSPWGYSIIFDKSASGGKKMERHSIGQYKKYSDKDYKLLKELQQEFEKLYGELISEVEEKRD